MKKKGGVNDGGLVTPVENVHLGENPICCENKYVLYVRLNLETIFLSGQEPVKT